MLVKVKSQTGGPIMVPITPENGPVVTNDAGRMILLVDGWNEIQPEDWPNVEATMETGVANGTFEYKCKTVEEEYETEVDGKKVKQKREVRVQMPLGDVRADQARDIVKNCFNPFVLKAWAGDYKLTAELRNLADIALNDIQKLGEKK